MKAVLLAGGMGRRLEPYTTILPKPLMPLGGKSIIEIIIRQLKKCEITDITIAVGHLAELIMSVLGDGSKHGVKITYSKEDVPLGTAGPLSLINDLPEEIIVMNGDLLTNINFSELIVFHRSKNNVATISSFTRSEKIDFGVLTIGEDNMLKQYIEKPVYDFRVSMGIYVFKREILEFVKNGTYLDLPNLMTRLINNKVPIAVYDFNDIWLDIGRTEDYSRAQELIEREPSLFV